MGKQETAEEKATRLENELKASKDANTELKGKLKIAEDESKNATKAKTDLETKLKVAQDAGQKANDDLAAEKDAHQKTSDNAAEEIRKLSEELASVKDNSAKGIVTVKDSKGVEYKVSGKRFNHKGDIITADQLGGDKKLIDELVSMGVGFLTEVKK